MTLTLRMVSAGLATLALLASIILLGNQRHAYALSLPPPDLGSTIVCTVYSDVDTIGPPVNIFPDQCHNTPAAKPQCSDGIDNDSDGLKDTTDPGCHTDGNASNAASYDPSRNAEYNAPPPPPPAPACSNGIDDDADGLVDSADPGCHSDFNANNAGSYTPNGNDESAHAPPPPPPGAENTLALCSDGIDNDGEGLIDLADQDCAAFKPSVLVKKFVINTGGGTATSSDFTMHATSPGIAESFLGSTAGTTVLLSIGAFAVSESGPLGYGMATSTGCAGIMGIGSSTICTVTNTFHVATTTSTTTDATTTDTATTTTTTTSTTTSATSTDNGAGNSNNNTGSSDNGNNSTGQPPANGGGGSSGDGGGGGSGSGVGIGATVAWTPIDSFGRPGLVLGASTDTPPVAPNESCDKYLTAFIKSGAKNDENQVKRLQYVLRNFEGAKISLNGVYDAPTLAAVHAFQTKYAADILTPWGITKSTGYTYLTTRKKVNEIYCRNTKQFPLTTAEQQTIQASRSGMSYASTVQAVVKSVPMPSIEKSLTPKPTPPAPAAQETKKSFWDRVLDVVKGVRTPSKSLWGSAMNP